MRRTVIALMAVTALVAGCDRPHDHDSHEGHDHAHGAEHAPAPTNRVDIPEAVRRNLGVARKPARERAHPGGVCLFVDRRGRAACQRSERSSSWPRPALFSMRVWWLLLATEIGVVVGLVGVGRMGHVHPPAASGFPVPACV